MSIRRVSSVFTARRVPLFFERRQRGRHCGRDSGHSDGPHETETGLHIEGNVNLSLCLMEGYWVGSWTCLYESQFQQPGDFCSFLEKAWKPQGSFHMLARTGTVRPLVYNPQTDVGEREGLNIFIVGWSLLVGFWWSLSLLTLLT